MSNAWLVRPNPHNISRINEFKTQNIIAVGWPGIGDLTGKSREEIKSLLEGAPYHYTSLELGNSYATIDILVNQINIDDLILIPNHDDIYFAKVLGPYKYDSSKDNNTDGYPHQRSIKFLTGPINRSTLPSDLRNSLKVHRATADLSKHYNSIKALSEGSTPNPSNNTPINNEFIEVEYPIRANTTVKLNIPNNLTQNEAERLSNFVKTLYFN
ncbi:MAG: hypothetical protein E7207_08470 [Clostridium butyricum]|nr:hypothetical protein [Clostridium butyricum]